MSDKSKVYPSPDILLDRTRYPFFGVQCHPDATEFRLYCPFAESVEVLIYTAIESDPKASFSLQKDENDVWYLKSDSCMQNCWIRYRIDGAYLYADPFSHHITTDSSYQQHPLTLLKTDSFEWSDQDWTSPSDPRDLVIYECHVKDMVALSGSVQKGIYSKWVDEHSSGGLKYIKELGVNAVEFLPLFTFAQQEPPYQIRTPEGFYNEWNRLETNHWGYMTSFFLAPEAYYASDAGHDSGYPGYHGKASDDLKHLINACHQEGISVILDVVYNHSSIFDINILNSYLANCYLRYDDYGNLLNRSGTGNEINTESAASKRLILDSILHWITEYHVDGFRFDLAGLLDKTLWDEISSAAKALNPKILLIAEPWGGNYLPHEFSDHGWASWNDRFRNGIKGIHPYHENGFIFSNWISGSTMDSLQNWLSGTVRGYADGLFHGNAHSVNYLESHDGYTLADTIRLAYRPELRSFFSYQNDEILPLSPIELASAKLAALILFTTPGILMIHQGQEFANSKICRSFTHTDESGVFLDHNSYEKDDPTNWIDFSRVHYNQSLFQFYKGLIQIRHSSPALRTAERSSIEFGHVQDPLQVIKSVQGNSSRDIYDYIIGLNAHPQHSLPISLPKGTWEVIVDDERASVHPLDFIEDQLIVSPKSGFLLRKLHV